MANDDGMTMPTYKIELTSVEANALKSILDKVNKVATPPAPQPTPKVEWHYKRVYKSEKECIDAFKARAEEEHKNGSQSSTGTFKVYIDGACVMYGWTSWALYYITQPDGSVKLDENSSTRTNGLEP